MSAILSVPDPFLRITASRRNSIEDNFVIRLTGRQS